MSNEDKPSAKPTTNAPAKPVNRPPRNWILTIFDCDQARNGGIIRRNKKDIVKFATMDDLQDHVYAEGFHMVEGGGQVIIFCNISPIIVYC